jgi:hypothetical protein
VNGETSLQTPERRVPAGFISLLIGNVAAPIFWLGQLMLGYIVSTQACYGSDHPTVVSSATALRTTLYAFDGVAILAAIAGGIVSLLCWRAVREPGADARFAAKVTASRARFMAMWGMMSSLWFLGAVVFTTIATATVRLCVQ